MFCSNCGREIADDSKVCGYCGTPVGGSRQETEYHQTQNIYGEPKANYSGQAENPYSNSQYQGTPGTGYGTPQNMDGGATGMGIASMILGIVALLTSCCVSELWLTFILAAASIVLGILALQKHTGGRGMAIAGIVCSCVSLVLGILIMILCVAPIVAFFTALFQ